MTAIARTCGAPSSACWTSSASSTRSRASRGASSPPPFTDRPRGRRHGWRNLRAMSQGWKAVALDEVESVPWRGRELMWHPLRAALGARIVGMAAFTADRAGQEVVEGHTETEDGRGHEEVYVVLRGRATFTLDGEELDAPAGTFVLVEPAVHRRAVAAEPDTAMLALGGSPDFVPGAGEWIDRARPYARSDPQPARAILDDLRAARPASPGIAIGEALLAVAQGDEAGARARLEKVLAREPSWRVPLAADPDLGRLGDQSGSASVGSAAAGA